MKNLKKNNWQTKKLGEICDIIAGQSPESKFYNKTGDGLPFYQGKKEFGEKFISKPTTWTSKVTKEALDGDILMSVRAPVGPINFATEKICIGRGLAAIRVSKSIDKDFLFNFLQLFESEIVGNKGAVFDSISKTQIENIEILLPSILEQKRIVKILDEVFKNVAKAKENAEKNLKNSKELFESYLQNIFKNPERSWKKKGISDVCEVISGGTPKTNIQKYWDGNLCWVTPKDLGRVNSDIISDTSRKITQEGLKKSSAKLLPVGSVILSSRAPIGYVVINAVAMATNQGCKSFICGHQIYNKFLYYFLISNTEYLNSLGSGTTFKEISGGVLKNIKISLPSLSKQKAIVKKLDALSAETKKLEGIYQQKLADLEELKKSVLKSAFAGEL